MGNIFLLLLLEEQQRQEIKGKLRRGFLSPPTPIMLDKHNPESLKSTNIAYFILFQLSSLGVE